jgi:hypothetical protein
MEMRLDHGLWKVGQDAPRGGGGARLLPRPPPAPTTAATSPPPSLGLGEGVPSRDDGDGADRRGGVAASAVEDVEDRGVRDPGVEVETGWGP